jgi:hypothetical protein
LCIGFLGHSRHPLPPAPPLSAASCEPSAISVRPHPRQESPVASPGLIKASISAERARLPPPLPHSWSAPVDDPGIVPTSAPRAGPGDGSEKWSGNGPDRVARDSSETASRDDSGIGHGDGSRRDRGDSTGMGPGDDGVVRDQVWPIRLRVIALGQFSGLTGSCHGSKPKSW